MWKIKSFSSPFIISLVVFVSFWHLSTTYEFISPAFVPKPSAFCYGFIDLFLNKGFLGDIGISVWRVGVSCILSFVIAIQIALIMSEFKIVYKILSPYIDFIRYLPVPAIVPISILCLGIGESAKIFLLIFGTFFHFLLLVLDHLKGIPKDYYDLAYTLHFNKLQSLKMKLNLTLPQIYDSCRISIGICWTYLIIAEYVASTSGLGHVIKDAQRFFNIPNLYVGIITIGFIGFFTDFSLKKLYPMLFKYKTKNGEV